jgi:cytochrome P450
MTANVASGSERTLESYNLFDAGLQESPWDFNARLRREAPVWRDPNTGIYLISTYDLAIEALKSWQVFSNRFGVALGGAKQPPEVAAVARQGWPPVDTMLTADPPEQKRFRSLVNKAFSVRRVTALVPRVQEVANALIDAFIHDGRVELRAAYGVPLPLTIIAEQLGVPREDLPTFKHWSDGFVAQLSGMVSRDREVEAARRILEYQHYFAKVLEDRAARPRDDIISDLVHARVEGERSLDTAECLSIIQQLLVAGNETTASTICEGMLLFARNPEQWEKVVARPELIDNAVEEILRLTTPTANMWRRTSCDTRIGGVEIPKGAMVLVRYASANRDERVFPDPDRFDVERANAPDHLAFGYGIHFCLGAQLARKELQQSLRAFSARMANPRITPGSPPPRHSPNILLRGLDALHLDFDPV